MCTGHTTGVEGPHRELGTRLTDRLGSDDADRFTKLDVAAGCERHAVARRGDAERGVVGQRRQHANPVDRFVVAERFELVVADHQATLVDGAVSKGDVIGEDTAEQARFQMRALVGGVGHDVVDPDAGHRAGAIEGIFLVDDELLRHVDEATGQVAGVRRTQRRVDESLAGARRGDEVLEHLQAFAEVALDGTRDHVTTRVGDEATHARNLADLHHVSSSTRVDHHVDRVELLALEAFLHPVGHLFGGFGPDLDLHLTALTIGDDAATELLLDLVGLLLVTVEDLALLRRGRHVVDRDREARLHGVLEAHVLDGVERDRHDVLVVATGKRVDQRAHLLLADLLVDERVLRRERLVEEGTTDRGGLVLGGLAVGGGQHELGHAVLDRGVDVDVAEFVRRRQFVDITEHPAGTLGVLHEIGEVVRTDDHVLRGRDQRAAVSRAEHVVGAEHEHTCLGLRLSGQRQMDRHLVAVEVGVKSGADQRVQVDRLALDQHRLERLDAETVQGRCTVQEHRMLLDDVLKDIPHLRATALDHALGRLDVLGEFGVDQTLHDERLEQLERHDLRQTALVELQGRADHDDRTARVVDALAEQVLAEAALLALEHVGQRLQRPVAGSGDRTATTPVVEQRVDGFLEHALFVVHDDLGRTEIEQPLQAVVAVDDTAVQVVEVGGREAATIELDHRTKLRRDHRHDVEDHGARVVDAAAVLVAAVERSDDLQPLDRLLLALRAETLHTFRRVDLLAELGFFIVEVEMLDEAGDRVGTHAAVEVVAPAILQLTPQHLVLDDLTAMEGLELVPRPIEDLLFELELFADLGEVLVGLPASRLEFGLLGAILLEVGKLGLEILAAASEIELHVLVDGLTLTDNLGLQRSEILVTALLVNRNDKVGSKVDDLLELLGLELFLGLGAHEEVGEPRTGATQVPDVHGRGGELDMAHPLTANLRAGHLDATALTDDALEANPLVLTAGALPVLGRTEDLLAEEAVLLGLERAVVDGLGLLDLTVGPHADAVRGREPNFQVGEIVDVEHDCPLSVLVGLRRGPHERRRGLRLLRRIHVRAVRCRSPAPRPCGMSLRRARASRSPDRRARAPRR